MSNLSLLEAPHTLIDQCAGQTIVIKFGGEVADDAATLGSFCAELAQCVQAGIKVVIVHGGGKQATEMCARLGYAPQIVNGRRITDENVLDVVKMVFAGKINIEILSALRKAGLSAVGLSGVDGKLVEARRRPPKTVCNAQTGCMQTIDYGFVGDIVKVDTHLLHSLLRDNVVPVIASLAGDEQGNIYNVNADTVAAEIARALAVDRWLIATNVDGLWDDQGEVIGQLSCAQVEQLIKAKVIRGGMIPKAESAVAAVRAGVKSVHIVNGMKTGRLVSQLCAQPSAGTTISD